MSERLFSEICSWKVTAHIDRCPWAFRANVILSIQVRGEERVPDGEINSSELELLPCIKMHTENMISSAIGLMICALDVIRVVREKRVSYALNGKESHVLFFRRV